MQQSGLADGSLQTYAIAKGLARDVNSAHIAAHVANLKRDLGRRGRLKGSTKAAKQMPPPLLPLPKAAKGGGADDIKVAGPRESAARSDTRKPPVAKQRSLNVMNNIQQYVCAVIPEHMLNNIAPSPAAS